MLLVILILALGCARAPGPEARPQIGFLLSSMEKERYHKDRASFVKRVEELGGQVVFDSAGGDGAEQRRIGSEMLAKPVDVLVVQPVDGETGRFLAREAKSRKIPIVAYDRLPAHAEFDWFVSHDSRAVGRAQVEYAAKALGGSGRLVVLRGPSENSVAEEITQGVLTAAQEHPGLEIVAVVPHTDWSPKESADSTARLLQEYPDLAGILANNSALGRGAMEALRAAGKADEVYLAGADADLTNTQWLVQGRPGMEVLKPIVPLATAAADLAMALARGGEPAAGPTVDRSGPIPGLVLPVQPFDRSTVDAVIVQGGFHPREALYGRDGTEGE